MIDREHDLPITKQAEVLRISRGSVYYLPRPVPEADHAGQYNKGPPRNGDPLYGRLRDPRAATAGRLIQTTPRGRFCVAQSTLIHTNPQCDADHLFAPSPPTGLLGQANQSPGPFLLELKTFRR